MTAINANDDYFDTSRQSERLDDLRYRAWAAKSGMSMAVAHEYWRQKATRTQGEIVENLIESDKEWTAAQLGGANEYRLGANRALRAEDRTKGAQCRLLDALRFVAYIESRLAVAVPQARAAAE